MSLGGTQSTIETPLVTENEKKEIIKNHKRMKVSKVKNPGHYV